jgi:DNA-binding transcriptional LysR family regulator
MDRLASMAVFAKVAELGSFSAAADTLGLSKSAVSKHVTALEERLGVRLVNRTTRRLALTEVGLSYRETCARIVQEVEEAEQEAGRHGSEPRGRLKVTAPMTFGILHLAPLLPDFLAAHPRLEIDLALDDRIVDLLEEGVDVALRIGTLRDSSLIARRIATARSICAASPAYLQANGTPLHPADLGGHNCLRYTYRRGPEAWELERHGERHAVRLRGNLAANNGDALRAAAVGGLGIVVLPDFIVADDLASGRLVHLLADWRTPEFPIQAVWPPQRHPSPKLRAFVDFLAERLARRCPGQPAPRPAFSPADGP